MTKARESRAPKPGEAGHDAERENGGDGKNHQTRSFQDAATKGERNTENRETKAPGDNDKVWTVASKDTWDNGPTPMEHQAALAKQKAPKE